MMTASNKQPYMQARNGASTGGFLLNEKNNRNRDMSFKRPEEQPDGMCQFFSNIVCCGFTHSGTYEPSPVFSGMYSSLESTFAGVVFLVLHVVTLITSTFVAARYNAVDEDLTTEHETNFILNFAIGACVLQWLSTLLTAVYFGITCEAYRSVFVPYICLLFQLFAAVMMMLLFNWIVTAADEHKNMRPQENDTDSIVAATAYLMIALVAAHITLPITGVYTKLLSHRETTARAVLETNAKGAQVAPFPATYHP